MKTAKT